MSRAVLPGAGLTLLLGANPVAAEPHPVTEAEAETEAESADANRVDTTESAEADPPRSLTIPVLHGLGLFTALRLTEAWLYPDPFAETRLSVIGDHYAEAFTRPPKFDASKPAFEWDGDPWYINVVGHSLLGSELYLRGRSCGFSVLEGLIFTTAGAVVWDYGFEASGVRPSAFDLVYTPLAGSALGEFRYFVWKEAASIDQALLRGVVRGFFDPFGELERFSGTKC